MNIFLATFLFLCVPSWTTSQQVQYGPPQVQYGVPSGGYTDGGSGGYANSLVPVGGDVRQNNVSCEVDLAWFGSHSKWYIPLWSNFYRLRTASELLDLDEETIYAEVSDLPANTCLEFFGTTVAGFGKSMTFDIQGGATAINFKAPTTYAKRGNFKFTFTDNEDFVVGVTTWEDNSVSWAVLTHRQQLDSQKKQKVLEGLRFLGFDVSNAYDESYVGCL